MSEVKEKKSKEKKKTGLLYKIIMFILICIIVFSLYKVGTILYKYYVGRSQYSEIEKIAGAEDWTGEVDWAALIATNENMQAWLYSEDTIINYPVVQGDDNSFYLTHMFNKQYNGAGTLFIDTNIEDPFNCFNTIIYGHHMKDGSMFGSLVKYRDEEDYYSKHKKMELLTRTGRYELEIFAVKTIPAESELYTIGMTSDSEKENYLKAVLEDNEITTDVSVTTADNIVMLSTCTYEFENARLVVYGKLVEK